MQNRNGFTLVEIAMVITVIGLLIGAISLSTKLVNHFRLTRTLTEIDELKSGVNLFRAKYNAYPGDMTNASSYWASAQNPGNGNELYEQQDDATSADINNTESFAAMQHLALAEIIDGTYTGSYGSGPVRKINLPASAYNSYTVYYFSTADYWGTYSTGVNKILLTGTANSGFDDFQVRTIDAYNMDLKIDDRNPFSGLVGAINSNSSNCTSVNVSTATNDQKRTATYLMSSPETLCSMTFGLEQALKIL